ncbi:MAG: hypothetical protein D6805_02635 [Planctomycetota bacterium]|nr:MAG: hypothetical protein D6805_02635 [Planctomycetota bacterium]
MKPSSCPKDYELFLYLNGEKKSLQKHVHNCPKCRKFCDKEKQKLQKLKKLFTSPPPTSSSSCPSLLELNELSLQQTNHPRQKKIQLHLLECPHCRESFASLQQTQKIHFQITTKLLPLHTYKKIRKQLSTRIQLRKKKRKRYNHPFLSPQQLLPLAATLLLLATGIFSFLISIPTSHAPTLAHQHPNPTTKENFRKTSPSTPSPQSMALTPSKPKKNYQTHPRLHPQSPNHPLSSPQNLIPTPAKPKKNKIQNAPLTPQKNKTPPPQKQTSSPRPTLKRTLAHNPSPISLPKTIALYHQKGKILLQRNGQLKIFQQPTKIHLQPGDKIHSPQGAYLQIQHQILCTKKQTTLAFPKNQPQPSLHLTQGTLYLVSYTPSIPLQTKNVLLPPQTGELLLQKTPSHTLLTCLYGKITYQSINQPQQQRHLQPLEQALISSKKIKTRHLTSHQLPRWIWKWRSPTLFFDNFEQPVTYWKGALVHKNTYQNSHASLRSLPIDKNPWWGSKILLEPALLRLRYHPQLHLRLAYYTPVPTTLLLQIFNRTQNTTYAVFLKTQPKRWQVLDIPLRNLRRYNNKYDQIQWGDVLENIEIYGGTPKNNLIFLIDNFQIYYAP